MYSSGWLLFTNILIVRLFHQGCPHFCIRLYNITGQYRFTGNSITLLTLLASWLITGAQECCSCQLGTMVLTKSDESVEVYITFYIMLFVASKWQRFESCSLLSSIQLAMFHQCSKLSPDLNVTVIAHWHKGELYHLKDKCFDLLLLKNIFWPTAIGIGYAAWSHWAPRV